MTRLLTRRKIITTGLSAIAGASGLAAAARLADRFGLIPPDHGGIYGAGETLTYAAQRVLTSRGALAREFSPSQISTVAPINGPAPSTLDYRQLLARRFSDWRLEVDGLVSRPSSLSLADQPADHPSGLRRGLVVHRGMDWRAALARLEPRGRQPAREVCGVLRAR